LIGLELPFSNFINDIYNVEIRNKSDKFEIWVMPRAAYEEELLDALHILGMKIEIENFNWQTGEEFFS
jgi:hypothetical protein